MSSKVNLTEAEITQNHLTNALCVSDLELLLSLSFYFEGLVFMEWFLHASEAERDVGEQVGLNLSE